MPNGLKTSLRLLAVIGLLSGCSGYDGQPSDHYDGRLFYNRDRSDKNMSDVIRMLWGSLSQSEQWPSYVENPAADRLQERVYEGVRATYVNHATVLLQFDGMNMLTDPVYSERVSPVSFLGPKRVRDPGIPLSALPEIDVVLISHNHYDHLDTDTLIALQAQQAKSPLVVTGLGNRALLEEIGLHHVVELDWDESIELNGVKLHFVECRHRSGRGVFDHMKTLWGSFVVETTAGRIYFAGDTGYSPHFAEQGEQWGPFVLSLLPIGAYEPRWFMKDIHLNPAEAVQAHVALRSAQSLAIHYGVFQLTYEGINDPEEDLQQALTDLSVPPTQFWVLEPGQARALLE